MRNLIMSVWKLLLKRSMIKLFFNINISIYLFFISCQKLEKVTLYHDNGKIKEIYYVDNDNIAQGEYKKYYESGNLRFQSIYTNNDLLDSLYYYKDTKIQQLESVQLFINDGFKFYKDFQVNGVVRQYGVLEVDTDLRIGKWKNFDDKGNHHFTKEYKIIDGESFTNQMWVTLPSGDTTTEGVSINYHFDKERLKANDSIYCFFQIEVAAYSHKPEIPSTSVILPEDYTKANFNEDFSNRPIDYIGAKKKEGIPVRRYSNLEQLKNIPKLAVDVPKDKYNETVAFYWKPKRIGKDTIKGYFIEEIDFIDKTLPANKDKDSIRIKLFKEIFFEHPIEVVE